MINLFKKWFGSAKVISSASVDEANPPQHIAIIMDGNGRWARERSLPRVAGHHKGMKVVKNITLHADRLGVKYLTLYAFSTENWKRPQAEIDFLMKLPQEFLGLELHSLIENNVQVRMMGYKEHLPEHTLRAVENAIEKTAHNTGLVLTFALNYGSRLEMIHAMRELGEDIQAGKLQPEQIDEAKFSERLLSKNLPDPDLLIRTSGELRLSNFMLWQLAYSEFWFTNVFWPDFSEQHLTDAVQEYKRRKRRFGGL